MEFSVHDVLDAAEQIIKADTATNFGEMWTLEDEIALNRAAPPSNADAPGLVIISLFLLLVGGSIMLVNWYFHSTYGV